MFFGLLNSISSDWNWTFATTIFEKVMRILIWNYFVCVLCGVMRAEGNGEQKSKLKRHIFVVVESKKKWGGCV